MKRFNPAGWAVVLCSSFVLCLGGNALAQVDGEGVLVDPPEAPYANEMEALIDFQRAKEWVQAGRYIEALDLLENIIQVAPRSSVRYYLGRAYAGLGRCPEALVALLDLDENLPESVAKVRDEEVVRCMRFEVERSLREGDCTTAKRLVAGLKGRVAEKELTWRESSVEECLKSDTSPEVPISMSGEGASDVSSEEIWGWSMITTFAALGGVSVYYGFVYNQAVDEMEKFEILYNGIGTTQKLGELGMEYMTEAKDAQATASDASFISWISGGMSVVTLGVGLYLLLQDSPTDVSQKAATLKKEESATWQAWATPFGVGVSTRF